MMDLTSFKLDIDDLLDEFSQGKYTTLADMKMVWMTMKFSYIYQAKPAKKVAFFMQSLFSHCISYMASHGDLSRRLGGLYCLYCLYETQPYKPCFKIYLSLEELKRLKALVVDAKENGTGVAPALVKRMLEKNMFLFGAVEIDGGAVTQRLEDLRKLQRKRVQIAYEKLFSNTRIDDFLHLDLGAELEMKELKKMSSEYAKAKELAIKEASSRVDIENLKHISEDKKLVGDMVAEIVEEWDAQKEEFYKQTGISQSSRPTRIQDNNTIVPFNNFEEVLERQDNNTIVPFDNFEEELEHLLSE